MINLDDFITTEDREILKKYIPLLEDKNGNLIGKKHQELLKKTNRYSILCENISRNLDISIKAIRYILINDIHFITKNCLVCNKILDSIMGPVHLRQYCSGKCAANSKEIREKIKQTNLKKYGVEISSQSAIVKEKMKNTCLEKYGVENPGQSKEAKAKRDKTNLEKFGTLSALSNKDVRNKIKKTNLEKYGVDCVLQNILRKK
jgi:hypothetical protein